MTNAIDTGFCSYRTSKEKNLLILQQYLLNLNKKNMVQTLFTLEIHVFIRYVSFEKTRQLTLKFGLTIQMLHENESF